MTQYTYTRAQEGLAPVGLVVLQTDETIEQDMRRMLPPRTPVYVTRVPSAPQVTPESLREMAQHLTQAARLLPQAVPFSAIGYGCTSATSQIGADKVARLIGDGVRTERVSDPLSALVAACTAMGITRLALLSPYTADVSDRLRAALASAGIETPVFGSFNEADEACVVRIDAVSLIEAACDLAGQGDVNGIFLSCTNLRTLDVIAQIEGRTGLPCLSSNQALAWHLSPDATVPGRLADALR
ncbi:aspartate/glutamate racemase family protein [uncultured Sulfitobacter sp.]|uniref:maleate cis-trans isomerase family protein n=1 Tax=uncultured Sulfitobacter sp. TaxID=191468 RepID=UPI00260A0368|nr:aspartate/glutamate racemase family protein [uncultured Sulfitobacter sp.]